MNATIDTDVSRALYLLERAARAEDQEALGQAEDVLLRIGPQTGKNLVDSALPAYAYLTAYAQTGRPRCREDACRLLQYALRQLRLPTGGFAGGLIRENAMMVAALAKASRVLGEMRYLRAAESTRMFLKIRLTAPDGTLYHCWGDHEAAADGTLEDYAYYCWALVELYKANYSVSCLREAVKIADKLEELFFERNAVAALALGRLWRLTGRERYRELWQRQLAWLSGDESCWALLAMTEARYPEEALLCVSTDSVPVWLAGTAEEYRLSAVVKTCDNGRALERLAPYTGAYPIPEKGIRLYFCRDGAGAAPLETLEQLRRRIAAGNVSV